MRIGSHNSWSYLPVKEWWMKPFAFAAKCQNVDIAKQYLLGVRCFDFRVRMTNPWNVVLVHGWAEYEADVLLIEKHLRYLNDKGDCYVRVILDTRTKKLYTQEQREWFANYCRDLEKTYSHIKFWCGRNLYNWETEYTFRNFPTCEECYASVCSPKLLDDWWPWLFAKLHNRRILRQGTTKDILLMDYINIK